MYLAGEQQPMLCEMVLPDYIIAFLVVCECKDCKIFERTPFICIARLVCVSSSVLLL